MVARVEFDHDVMFSGLDAGNSIFAQIVGGGCGVTPEVFTRALRRLFVFGAHQGVPNRISILVENSAGNYGKRFQFDSDIGLGS